MKSKNGVNVHTATAIRVPATFALAAIDTILEEFSQHEGHACLALDLQQMRAPFAATISVPIQARVTDGASRHEWNLKIRAASSIDVYPSFEGILKLLPAAENGSELQLDGQYVVPFGAIGRTIDLTFLRGAAQSSLERFVREIANRVAALSHWAQVT